MDISSILFLLLTDDTAPAAKPQTGEIIITEIMQNPDTTSDLEGEYFEIYNTTNEPLTIFDCSFSDNNGDSFTILTSLIISPNSYATFAGGANPGFSANYQWNGGFSLPNGLGSIELSCDGVVIDTVSYDNGVSFPDPVGASMNLDPGSFDAILNDDGERWCTSTVTFNGDLGTPGEANSICP